MSAADDSDDRELVARFLRARDESSFRALYRRHTPALYGLALRLLGHRSADADDVIQDTWIRAAERLNGFRWESTVRTWLASIAVNCCRERLRTGWRWVQEDDTLPERSNPDVPALELTLAVDRAIATLPAGCRGVFVLHDIEGRTHEEIGALLDIAPGTSKSQLFHARRHLRALLR
ncbi:MAG: sigma-70 family RNA polymerase sigma factor [Vicinamibacterales bacterium]